MVVVPRAGQGDAGGKQGYDDKVLVVLVGVSSSKVVRRYSSEDDMVDLKC